MEEFRLDAIARVWLLHSFGWRRKGFWPCKGDGEKGATAWELCSRTTMTLKWIAQRLKMGAWTYVSNCLVQKRKQLAQCRKL